MILQREHTGWPVSGWYAAPAFGTAANGTDTGDVRAPLGGEQV